VNGQQVAAAPDRLFVQSAIVFRRHGAPARSPQVAARAGVVQAGAVAVVQALTVLVDDAELLQLGLDALGVGAMS
jgi:hypothetical protein